VTFPQLRKWTLLRFGSQTRASSVLHAPLLAHTNWAAGTQPRESAVSWPIAPPRRLPSTTLGELRHSDCSDRVTTTALMPALTGN
jgi:hypothetical protein